MKNTVQIVGGAFDGALVELPVSTRIFMLISPAGYEAWHTVVGDQAPYTHASLARTTT